MAMVIYTVQPGDTLWKLSRQFGVTVQEIADGNQIVNADQIHPGQRLRIEVPPRYDYYVVRPGDSLYSIAKRFGTTPETLAARNRLRPPYRLSVGQILRVR